MYTFTLRFKKIKNKPICLFGFGKGKEKKKEKGQSKDGLGLDQPNDNTTGRVKGEFFSVKFLGLKKYLHQRLRQQHPRTALAPTYTEIRISF